MPKALFEILVPTKTNEGKPIRTRFHRVWDAKVRAISGGLTILKPGVGNWVSPQGELFLERMIPVRIFCTQEQINQVADITARYYRQEAVMFYQVSAIVAIVHYDEKGKRKDQA
jgi:hypothetical protein